MRNLYTAADGVVCFRSSHVNLTDDVGCTMKPNLLSPWLKTRQEKAVMAYR